MIDRAALEQLVEKHGEALSAPTGFAVKLLLGTGESLTVRGFLEYHDTYFVAQVFVEEALGSEDLEKHYPRTEKGRLIFDRMIIPYHLVSHITITARIPNKRKAFGFVEK